ncbi:hypothetical protein GF389_06155 [Candidatus Dojkabacteria bacterium]|nr:hypothetical protein [Candidatus Dojkabacteria bacterium]
MVSDKIFVNLDEEIVFTVEKIAKSASSRVIVVVPESANLVASLISLKLLSSQIARSNKVIVLVTEDKLGLRLSEKAGLISKEKISQITPEVWIKAEESKQAFLEERRKLKNTLISERQESGSYEIIDEASKEESTKDEQVEEEVEAPSAKQIKTEVSDGTSSPSAISQKPRLDPKVVNLGNIKVLAGGDIELEEEFHGEIAEVEAKPKQETIIEKKAEQTVEEVKQDESPSEKESENEKAKEEKVEKEPEESEEEMRAANLIGRDLSRIVPDNPKKRRMQQRDFAREKKSTDPSGQNFIMKNVERVRQYYSTGNTRLKLGVTAIAVLGLSIFLSIFVFNTASVEIYTKQQNVQVSKEVTGKVGGSDIDVENLVIPVYPLKLSESSSNSADTTGNVQDGNRAQGLITVYNKIEEEVSLPAGTELENISTGNKYTLMSATTVPPAIIDGGGNLNLGVKKDVSIQAASFGEKYNTSGTANYKFEGYATDEVDARSFNDIEGGDTSEEKAVVEGDIADLENGLIDELKNRLLNELRDSVADDEYFLEESVNYGTPDSSSDYEAGEKADSVTVSLELEATAYFVKKDELKQIVAEVIKSESDFEGEVSLDDLQNVEPKDVVVSDDEVKFKIDTKGDITANFTEEEIAQDLSGKSISAAKEYLDNKEGIEEFDLSVGPFYLPSFLKSMPSEDKINVEIQ